eukprot:jgi/Tetstr1/464254/TSEL_009059.t1
MEREAEAASGSQNDLAAFLDQASNSRLESERLAVRDAAWDNTEPGQNKRPLRDILDMSEYTGTHGLRHGGDPTTILNAVLSGYGLPQLRQGNDFTLYDEFEDDFTFEYPKRWVSRPNSLREGVYISDFNTADKVILDVVPPSDDLISAAVAKVVAPLSAQQDDRLEMPNPRLIKTVSQAEHDGRIYFYLEFPSSTITRSGYSVKRKNFAAVCPGRRGQPALVIAASARSDQYSDEKRAMLERIVQSFRAR